MQLLERFQNMTVRLITGNKETLYDSQLGLLNFLPLPKNLQQNSLLYVINQIDQHEEFLTKRALDRRFNDIFWFSRRQKEKTQTEVYYQKRRLVSRISR